MIGATGFLIEQQGKAVFLRAASSEEQIKESIRAVLLTRKGERPLRPELGSELYRFLFRPLTESLLSEIQSEVRESITRCEPRVAVKDVLIGAFNGEANQLEMRVEFEYKATGKNGMVKVLLYA